MQSDRQLLENRISRLLELTPCIEDDELRAELTKHLCVLVSGLLEVTCREILSRYTHKKCAPEIARVIGSVLLEFRNPSTSKIYDLLSQFDPKKAENWKNKLSDEEAAAVDSIVNNRHQIAHGRSIGLSFSVLERYYLYATKALASIQCEFPSY